MADDSVQIPADFFKPRPPPASDDPVVLPRDLPAYDIRYSDGHRRALIRQGKFPPPDVVFSVSRRGWYASTLRRWVDERRKNASADTP